MRYPNIRSYHEGRRRNHIIPLVHRRDFLNTKPLEILWDSMLPPANLKKNANIFELELALPGFEKNEIEVKVTDDILTIHAEKSKTQAVESDFVLKEFEMDIVERKFKLGKGIGHEKITAVYNNGILKLTFEDVPVEEEVKVKQVEID